MLDDYEDDTSDAAGNYEYKVIPKNRSGFAVVEAGWDQLREIATFRDRSEASAYADWRNEGI